LPAWSPLFNSPGSTEALERTIAVHLLRSGQFEIAGEFFRETGTSIPPELQFQFKELHRVVEALRNKDVEPALLWCQTNQDFLESRSSPLEFHLHRFQYMHLLLSDYPDSSTQALDYIRQVMSRLSPKYFTELRRLSGALAFLPLSRLQTSPYADLTSPTIHTDLEPTFVKHYCANLGMSQSPPLRVVGDIGGGGALVRIEKGRKVMKDKKGEWNQAKELLIEIPIPPENRYHSIFACPVSKEQATETNHPMMMTCGHVLAKDSLGNMSKMGGRVKCPYCPVESSASQALRVYF